MGVITAIIVFVEAVIVAVFSRLLVDEAKAWLPRTIEFPIKRAVHRTPCCRKGKI